MVQGLRVAKEDNTIRRKSRRILFWKTVPQRGAVPGAVIAIQTFRDFWDSILIAMFFARMAFFTARGFSRGAPRFDPKDLRAIFEHRVLRMLIFMKKITWDLMPSICSCGHSGFQVYAGPQIQHGEGGFDLASLNIKRSRDHGLPD